MYEQGLSKMSKSFILETEEAETSPVRKWKNIRDEFKIKKR